MDPAKPESELRRLYERMLRPLTLFPRQEPLPEPPERHPQDPFLPLPVFRLTPASLCQQVAERLARTGLALRVSAEARSHLSNVILDELKCGWQEPPPEPSLRHLDNQRLRKRLQAHVLLCSEQLFLRRLSTLAAAPATSAVFTRNAMLVRLAASLARDCAQLLTSPDVYQGLLADFQAQLQLQQAQGRVHRLRPVGSRGARQPCTSPLPCSPELSPAPSSSLHLNCLITCSRPVPTGPGESEQDPLKELMSIPQLRKIRPLPLLPSVPKDGAAYSSVQDSPQPQASLTKRPSPGTPTPSPPPTTRLVRKAESMPSLREGKRLADILGLPAFPTRPLSSWTLVPPSKPELAAGVVAEDLKQLLKNLKSERPRSPPLHSGLSPLVGALAGCQAGVSRLKGLQEMQREQEEAAAAASAAQGAPLTLEAPPDRSQPVTFTMRVKRGFVQGAAMLVSERSLESTYSVEAAGLLYNHLSGELEPKLIDKMDVDHFLGSSIREVYKELMGCVSPKYFSLEQEALVEEPAPRTSSTGILTSAFLLPGKRHAAINPELLGIASCKADPLQLSSGKMASFSSVQGLPDWDSPFKKLSWLTWWRATVSTDDYFRYLHKEDTDFLHVIFLMHQEEMPKEPPAPVKSTPSLRRPPPLLQDEEPDFVPGEWNWGSLTEYSERTQRVILEEPQELLDLQARLEHLWDLLEVPEEEQLDMVIKYSSPSHVQQLPLLVSAWEQALEHIRQREVLLGKLEWFERQASNPDRLFQRSHGPVHLLEENQVRSQLYQILRHMERPLAALLEDIETLFGEPVTFKGRSYLEKMQHDRVEMLFWLQQRRRMRHLLRAQKTKHRSSATSQR